MSIIDRALSIVAPSTCIVCDQEGDVLCGECAPVSLTPFGTRCYQCNRLSEASKTCPKCMQLGSPSHMWINAVHESTAERLVELYKFESHRAAGKTLARLMVKAVPVTALTESCLVVPLPTASTRRRQRGFDHSVLLAKLVAQELGLKYVSAVGRLGQSRQVGSSRAKRLEQSSHSYRALKPLLIKDQHILLVDDVVTTGASIRAVTQLLKRAGAKKVDAAVFAKRMK